jgi:hypothetical protein
MRGHSLLPQGLDASFQIMQRFREVLAITLISAERCDPEPFRLRKRLSICLHGSPSVDTDPCPVFRADKTLVGFAAFDSQALRIL